MKPALVLTLVLFLGMLQGCSLLFVAKGKTGMSAVGSKAVPKAKSLSRRMSRTNVIHYTVQNDDTLPLLGMAFYGEKSGESKLAKANHIKTTKPLKVGQVLRVVDPVYFPNGDDIKQQRKSFEERMAQITATPYVPGSGPRFARAYDPQTDLPSAKVARPKLDQAFAPGEKLVYEVKALSMVAGEASLEVGDFATISGRPCYPLIARAKAAFPFNTIYPVKDVQTSYLDAVDFITWKFENNVSEGNYKARNLEFYDQVKHRLVRQHNDEKREEIDVPPYVQDLISCFYYFRLLPIEVGKKYTIPTCSTGKNYNLVVNVIKREKLTIPLGTFDCYLVKPFVKKDTVFRNEADIDMWVTTDPRHVPVLIKSGIAIGSIEIALMQATLPEIKGVSGAVGILNK